MAILLKTAKKKDSVLVGIVWAVIFITGLILYLLAYSNEIPPSFYTITISIEATLKLFVFTFTFDDPVKEFGNASSIYQYLLFTCYIFACLWSTIMVKDIFFKGIANVVKVKIQKHLPTFILSLPSFILSLFTFPWTGKCRYSNYHYIIVGCGKSMKIFLSNLEERASKNNITIITGEDLYQSAESTEHFKELIEEGYYVIHGKADEIALKKAGLDNARRKTRIIAITECDEQNLTVADIVTQKIFSEVFKKELKKFMKGGEFDKEYRKLLNLSLDSLSFKPKSDKDYEKLSSEEKLIENEKRLKCPQLKQQIINNVKNINLEAHIMYSFIERTEHFAFAENAFGKVDFFNPYELRARYFFWEHPITTFIPNLIDTSKARLKGDFRIDGKIYKSSSEDTEYIIKNIFIGFGKANYQMLKESVLTGQLLGCDYNAIIYNENSSNDAKTEKASINQSMFKNHSSGLFFGDDETLKGEEYKYFDSPKEKYNIRFENGNVLTRDFYINIIDEIKNNYLTAIYIALGEDKLNIETACEIRQCLYEHGITKEKIRLFVKISKESVFNRDLVINNPKNIPIKIECFGFDKSIFTLDNIVNEALDKFAKTMTNKNHDTKWEFLIETERDINRQVAMAIKTKLNLLGYDLSDNKNVEYKIEHEKYIEKYVGEGNHKIKEIIEISKDKAQKDNEIALLNNVKNKRTAKKVSIDEAKNELNDIIKNRKKYILDYFKTDNDETKWQTL